MRGRATRIGRFQLLGISILNETSFKSNSEPTNSSAEIVVAPGLFGAMKREKKTKKKFDSLASRSMKQNNDNDTHTQTSPAAPHTYKHHFEEQPPNTFALHATCAQHSFRLFFNGRFSID